MGGGSGDTLQQNTGRFPGPVKKKLRINAKIWFAKHLRLVFEKPVDAAANLEYNTSLCDLLQAAERDISNGAENEDMPVAIYT